MAKEETHEKENDGLPVEIERLVSPRRCLTYILNNWELYAEWCQEGRNPIDFLMTMPRRITEKDIEWAQKSLEQKAG